MLEARARTPARNARAPTHTSPGPELNARQLQVGVLTLGRRASPALNSWGPVQAPRWLQARRTRSCSPNAPAKRGRARSPLSRRIPRLKSGFPAEPGQPGCTRKPDPGAPAGAVRSRAVQAPPREGLSGRARLGADHRGPPGRARRHEHRLRGTGLPQAPRLLPTLPGAAEHRG